MPDLAARLQAPSTQLQLEDGSRVAVIGGGPAGSFFSYFLLQIAERIGLELQVDIFEPRDFSQPAPKGCNMCGGIISESLVQNLAAEGINLPGDVVQRGIDSYFLHMDVGSVRIRTPLQEMRIGSVHRGGGPRGITQACYRSFDSYLLELAVAKGARLTRAKVEELGWDDGRPTVRVERGTAATYDLLVAATGVNTAAAKMFEALKLPYRPPVGSKTYICEFRLGRETIEHFFGSSMHVFLLNLPRLEFAAFVPKDEYVTLCLLGTEIDRALVQAFLNSPEVRHCMPPGWNVPQDFCHCSPKIAVQGAVAPFADRVLFIGDCGITRLYKDGIGAAYRTAKAAAKAAVFEGISRESFRRHFWPACRTIQNDNRIGHIIFAITREIQKRKWARRGLWSMVAGEQQAQDGARRMSSVLWDTFTGSAPYRHVFLRSLHPGFGARLLWNLVFPRKSVEATRSHAEPRTAMRA